MDPQHRILLEVAWAALESACVPPGGLTGSRTGVFLGITYSDYARVLGLAGPEALSAYNLTGCSLSFAAGRISYLLGLQGPAVAVDTACSSSLVAVHLACLSLRSRDSDVALAAGVNALLAPEGFVTTCKARMLAPDGHCKTFDARADGFSRGEGCGVVVLKRLADALAHRDNILAVMRRGQPDQLTREQSRGA